MEHYLILGLIGLALLLFALEVTRPDIVAIGVTLTLLLTGTVSIDEGFSGFSNPAVITVLAMFILSSGLVRTGVADHLAALITKMGGGHPLWLTVAVMLTVGVMSAFMNNIGAVAILLPTMFVIAQKSDYPVTKLLIPLSFGSLLGGLTTLIGTPPNLLCSMALEAAGFRGFRMFDFLPTGLAVMGAGALYMGLVGRFLIPARKESGSLTQQYQLQDYLTEVVVPEKSPLVGKSLADSAFRKETGLSVLRIRRAANPKRASLPSPATILQPGDRLIVEGNLEQLIKSKEGGPLKIYAETKFDDKALTGDNVELAEVAVAPRSTLMGKSINQGHLHRRFNVLVLALRRRGRTLQKQFTSVPLAVGDVLLVQGSPEAIGEMASSPEFLVANRLEHEARDSKRAWLALGIMAVAIASAATGLLHISVAGLLGVLLMAVTGCVRIQDMYQDVEWRVIFLIACMMPLGIAMNDEHTGTARWLADHVVQWTGGYGPLVVMASLFIFTTLITEVMSNAAAAVLLAPIGVAIAVGLGLEPYPFLMAIAMGASTTFLTPIGHQANVLVYGVGNYRFADFPRVGLLLNVLIFIVTLVVVPLVWPFTPLPLLGSTSVS
ncbi:MAG: sodium-coupled transporter [Verrucomicrobia bacterium]|nr:sodium-coupled transporter [Verrucomicrobiota bacterium]